MRSWDAATPRPSAGARDRYVRILAVTQGQDASGYPIETTSTLADVWMLKRDLSGDERFIAHQESARADHAWEMEYRADMDPELLDVPKVRRLQYPIGGRLYDIVAAAQIGRQDGVTMLTLAKVG